MIKYYEAEIVIPTELEGLSLEISFTIRPCDVTIYGIRLLNEEAKNQSPLIRIDRNNSGKMMGIELGNLLSVYRHEDLADILADCIADEADEAQIARSENE